MKNKYPMTNERKDQNLLHYGFTLIEMLIVLIVMGILLIATLHLSVDQIQKVKDKTVKESILAEMQSRYSRNLWSSSFAREMYDTMEVNIKKWENKIDFVYKNQWTTNNENTFMDKFEIKYITFNPDHANPIDESDVNIKYSPYKISCEIWEDNDKTVIITRVNDSRDYCFEINQKNCRLIEMSEAKCNDLKVRAHLE